MARPSALTGKLLRRILSRVRLVALLILVAGPRVAGAAEAYLSFEDSVNVGAIKWGAVALAVLIAVAIARYAIVTQLRKRRGGTTTHESQENPEEDFRSRAQELGFRGAEYKNLKRIASRLAPKTPGALLVSATGREYLVADLQRRALRREREVALLQGIRDRLSHLGDQPVHEREVVRLDAHLPVWVEPRRTAAAEPAPAPAPAAATEAVEEGGEGDDVEAEAQAAGEAVPGGAAPDQDETVDEVLPGFDDLASVQGKLLDLGMGGCAVEVDLDVVAGQIVEVWSADWEIHLPRSTGDVVSVEPATEDSPKVLHVHFMDPNADELAAAMEDIREREESLARRREEGDEAEEFGAFAEPAE